MWCVLFKLGDTADFILLNRRGCSTSFQEVWCCKMFTAECEAQVHIHIYNLRHVLWATSSTCFIQHQTILIFKSESSLQVFTMLSLYGVKPAWYTTLLFTHCWETLYRVTVRAFFPVRRTDHSAWQFLPVAVHPICYFALHSLPSKPNTYQQELDFLLKLLHL
jgi:hypothetical protein